MSKRDQPFDYSIITEKSIRPVGSREDGKLDSERDWPRKATSYEKLSGPTEEQIQQMMAAHYSSLQRTKNLDASSNPMEAWTVRGVSEEVRRRSKVAALITKIPIGEFVDQALRTAVQKPETLRRRGTATPRGKNGKIWTIRGVTPETRKLSRIAALQLGWTVGEFVDRALLDSTEWLKTEGFCPLE